jgi:hypothetical protein
LEEVCLYIKIIKIITNYLTEVARWIDMNKDMRRAGVRNWRIEARDRYTERRILEHGMIHLGL